MPDFLGEIYAFKKRIITPLIIEANNSVFLFCGPSLKSIRIYPNKKDYMSLQTAININNCIYSSIHDYIRLNHYYNDCLCF